MKPKLKVLKLDLDQEYDQGMRFCFTKRLFSKNRIDYYRIENYSNTIWQFNNM